MSLDGLLVIDKPTGWTSHDVVARTRRLCSTRRVGHAGTLDPMATGVLVLGVDRATKLLTFLVGLDKAYVATIRLGQTSVTDDAEGEVVQGSDATGLRESDIRSAVASLTGDITQRPSAVSAIKVDGVRSYARVRSGEDVELEPRPVTVRRFTASRRAALGGEPPGTLDLDVEVEVTSGTSVRALARDLGELLRVGGHLTSLRRTRVGRYHLDSALTLQAVEADPVAAVLPMAQAATAAFAVRRLTDAEERALRYGQRIERLGARSHDPVAGIGTDGELVAILDESGEDTRSRVVFPRG
ncbi:MAG: tRNA pseudouridine(55) synthase TruB [Ornithinimicrobium sp.]